MQCLTMRVKDLLYSLRVWYRLLSNCWQVPIIMHNESEQARVWSQIFSEETKKQSIPVIASWKLNERMYWFCLSVFFVTCLEAFPYLQTFSFLGTENYRVSTNRRPQIDTGKNKSMSGVGATTYHPQTARAWKCALKEPLLISKTKSVFIVILLHFLAY